MFKPKNASFAKFMCLTAALFLVAFGLFANSATSAAVAPMPDYAEVTAVYTERPVAPVSLREEAVEKVALDETGANIEEKMKDALTAVKKKIEIDDKAYPNFSYNYYPDEYGNENWNFQWSSADYNANISANVLGGGKIYYYGKYEYSEKRQADQIKLAKLNKTEAKNKAEAFLSKILGEEFSGYRLYQQNLGYPSDRYSLIYILNKNGYDYPNFTVYAEVDKTTGDVLSFSNYGYARYSTPAPDEIEYQDAENLISQDEALDAYLENIGLELVYSSYYDWEQKAYKVHPVYRLKNTYNQYISAKDGSLVDVVDSYGPMPNPATGARAEAEEMAYDQAAPNDAGVYFSEAELAELAKARDYISADRAIEIMAEAFELNLADLENFTRYSNLQSDYIEKDKYYWNVSLSRNADYVYEYYSIQVEAEKGTIISYSGRSRSQYYDYYDGGMIRSDADPEIAYTYAEARDIVAKKIAQLCPVAIDENFELLEPGEDMAANYYFRFVRKVNGIPFENNGIYVNFDAIDGKITSYSFTWQDGLNFPKLEGLVSPKAAIQSIADHVGYTIYYMSNGLTEQGNLNAELLYVFDGSVLADPYTGKCIDYRFEELKKPEPEPDYQDLKGHWSENLVLALADNGIYAWGGEEFLPDKTITKGELVDYLKFFAYNTYYFTQYGSGIFVNQNAYRLLEGYAADADRAITKQEAAKIICELAGYGELGAHLEIFTYPFNDDNCDPEYRGYVAIIKAFGLILGDDLGNYNGKSELTRAEAAAIVYNIVSSFYEK